MYSLDSDTINGLLRANLNLVRRVRAEPISNLWISTIVVEEIAGKQISYINSLRSQRRRFGRESLFLAELISALAAFQILPYTDEAEQIYQSWPPQIKRIGPNDCRIAASAILSGFAVITGNGRDFSAIPGVAWEDWSRGGENIGEYY